MRESHSRGNKPRKRTVTKVHAMLKRDVGWISLHITMLLGLPDVSRESESHTKGVTHTSVTHCLSVCLSVRLFVCVCVCLTPALPPSLSALHIQTQAHLGYISFHLRRRHRHRHRHLDAGCPILRSSGPIPNTVSSQEISLALPVPIGTFRECAK